MTPDQLRLAGEALYGPRWQTPLALDIGVADRTMRRWVAGDPIPEGCAADLVALLRKRLVNIEDVIGQLE